MFKIFSWNVNGLRAALGKGFADWFSATGADAVCLQETKAMEDSLKYLSHLVRPGETFEESTYFATIGHPIFNYDFGLGEHSDSSGYDLTIGLPIDITPKRTGETQQVVAGLALRNAFVFQIPAMVNELRIKIKLPDETFSQFFTEEDQLEFEEVVIKQGQTVDWGNYQIRLDGFDRSGNFKNYQAKKDDIALAGILNVIDEAGNQFQQKPVFILRDAQQFSIKDYHPQSGLHIRFSNIDPVTEQMTFRIAKDVREGDEFELLIAEDVPRDDILIVEANIFPGINLVWLGCLMMLGGLVMSLLDKRRSA